MHIGKELRKTPGQIGYALKRRGVIKNHMAANGYTEYIASELYKEIVNVGKKKDSEKKEKNTQKPEHNHIMTEMYTMLVKMQNDINEIKKALENIVSE